MGNDRIDLSKRLRDIESGEYRPLRDVDEGADRQEDLVSPLPITLPIALFTTPIGWAILIGGLAVAGIVWLIVHLLH